MPVRLLRLSGIALLLFLLGAATAAAAPRIDGEFDVSSVDTNTKIAAGPDGNVWLTLAFNEAGNDVARVTPSGEVTEYDIGSFANLWGITGGPEGNIWVAHNGGVTGFAAGDPEGLKKTFLISEIVGSNAIVTGPEGNLWVATDNNLVRIEPAVDEAKVFPVPGLVGKDIDVAGSLLAIASQEKIFTATPTDPPMVTEYAIESTSQGVAGSPGGQIAFTDPLASPEKVGTLTPPNAAQEIELLGDPIGVTFGPDGNFWIAQFAFGAVVRLTPDGALTPLGGLKKEGPRNIAAGPANTLWVTVETDGGNEKPDKVARISGVEKPRTESPPSPPDTKIGRAPKKKTKTRHRRAKIKFRFSSPTPDATFECALSRLRKRAKAPNPRFVPCRSPKVYFARPGRYRFMVRAVAGGLADPTPAKRFFRVVRKRRH
jgi:virginiamycin B lyase